MTPRALSAIHRAAFGRERPWTAQEFETLLESPLVTLFDRPHGFALCRTVAGDSELLTLAVDPAHQGHGIGRGLMLDWLKHCEGKADIAFLEVASDNEPALALYRVMGFAPCGLRKGYYARAGAPAANAILMQRRLTFGHSGETTTQTPEIG